MRTKDLDYRLKEIEEYNKRNNIEKYIILDNDLNEYRNKLDKLYLINYKHGLLKKI